MSAFGAADTGYDLLDSIENVEGGAGNDVIFGDENANVFYASAGDDQVNGRDGVDTFDASSATGALTVDISNPLAGSATSVVDGIDTALANIEKVVGGSAGDSFTGNSDANVFVGGAGNDTFNASAGGDTVSGGSGFERQDRR